MSTEHYSSYNKLTICLLREAFLDKDLSFDFLKNPPTYQGQLYIEIVQLLW